MRIKWKIFLAMFSVVLGIFSLGGTVLISATFRENLAIEENHGIEENKLLRSSMGAMLAAVSKDCWWMPEQVIEELLREKLVLPDAETQIRVWQAGELLYQVGHRISTDKIVPQAYPEAGEILQEITGEGYDRWLCTVSSFQVDESVVYLESWKSLEEIYRNRDSQYEIYRGMLLGAVILTTAVSFGVAFWISEPILSLSQVSRRIAEGDLSARANIRRKDELGSLALDVNRMADSLQKDIVDLQETNERQERFIGNFAHELKTPLTSIIGYGDLLRLKAAEAEFVQEAAGYIFSEGKRLEKLSARLLELVLLRKEHLTGAQIAVVPFLEKIDKVMQPVLAEKGIHFQWEAAKGLTMFGEELLLESVLLNLLDNARKACSEGGNIRVKVEEQESQIIWTVQDDGRGVEPEELEYLTEAFYMEDKSRSRKEGGAGLGLSICAEILRLHGASLRLESEPEKGMTVTMEFAKGGLHE